MIPFVVCFSPLVVASQYQLSASDALLFFPFHSWSDPNSLQPIYMSSYVPGQSRRKKNYGAFILSAGLYGYTLSLAPPIMKAIECDIPRFSRSQRGRMTILIFY